MTHVPLVRAAHLNVHLGVLREIGEPVDRALARAGLPQTVEDMPNAYLLVSRVLACVSACGGSRAAMHLGFRSAQRMTLGNLRPDTQRAFLNAPSGRARLEAMIRRCTYEDGALFGNLVDEGRNLRVHCDMTGFDNSPALAYSEWLQLFAFISAIRSFAGAGWCPEEVTMKTRGTPPDAAFAALPNARIVTSQSHCSVLVSLETLAHPCRVAVGPAIFPTDNASGHPETWTYVTSLRELLKPYVSDATAGLQHAADMMGTTSRTLQRRLGREGTTFRRVLDEARYEIACDLLGNHSMKIIDIAFAAGYENPHHFSRAFKRLAGLAPRDYRNTVSNQQRAAHRTL